MELMVVISAVSVLMTIAAGLVFQMLKIGQGERAGVVAASSLDRLARDLRDDARASAGPADLGPARLALALPEGMSVEYELGARQALRTVRKGGKVEHREQYRWPRGTIGRFESSRDDARPVIALVLAPDPAAGPAKSADPPYRAFRIEAVPGRDARLGGGGAR